MNLRAAINAKCRDCIVDELAAESAAVQIELCASWDCPLWHVRKVRPEGIRVPYSAPVYEEQGLSPAMAAFRTPSPYRRSPWIRPNRANPGEARARMAKRQGRRP